MKRIAAHYIFCSPDEVYPLSVIELDPENVITRIFSLNDTNVEPARTLFHDGTISVYPVSLANAGYSVDELKSIYQYVNHETITSRKNIIAEAKPLILDFCTNDSKSINEDLSLLSARFPSLSVFQIITASVFLPASLLRQSVSLKIGHKCMPVLWKSATSNFQLQLL